jgi:Xaa-Pro aminopeptidase
MILTLEPGIAVGDKIIVHEENIVITETAPVLLSPKSSKEMPVI